VEEIRAAMNRALSNHPERALQYGETEGLRELREYVARSSTLSRPVQPENVLIVSGSQQALDLIGRVFLDSCDRIIVENPTYLAALSAWRPFEPEFVPINDSDYGVDSGELKAAISQAPKLLYSVPNFQNPRGVSLNLKHRLQILEMLRDTNTLVVEDDPYRELRFEGEPIPGFLELASEHEETSERVISIGSFSKILAPGLRVGWVIAAEAVIDRMVRAKQSMDLHTSTLNQAVILELLQQNFLPDHLRKIRAAYRERRDVMLSVIAEKSPIEMTTTRPEGGMFLMARLPEHFDGARLLGEAISRGVAFVPGEEFYLSGLGKNELRLNFPTLHRKESAKECGGWPHVSLHKRDVGCAKNAKGIISHKGAQRSQRKLIKNFPFCGLCAPLWLPPHSCVFALFHG